MSLKPQPIGEIPTETVEVAKAAFPKRHRYIDMRDKLGMCFRDEDFTDLYSDTGQPALAPWRLALVTIMQFAEKLSDQAAADAVRGRMEWKYALGLELRDIGFHYSVLSEFRDRLLTWGAEGRLFERLLECIREKGLLKAGGLQRTDSTAILANIRTLNRLELVGQTLHHALNTLASVELDWLRSITPDEWFERIACGLRINAYRSRILIEINWRAKLALMAGHCIPSFTKHRIKPICDFCCCRDVATGLALPIIVGMRTS